MSVEDLIDEPTVRTGQLEEHRGSLAASWRLCLWLKVRRHQELGPHHPDDHALVRFKRLGSIYDNPGLAPLIFRQTKQIAQSRWRKHE